MAKEYEVKCPYCKDIRKIMFSDLLGQINIGSGMRGVEDEAPSPESLNEENWIDLKDPCPNPNCRRKFSFNIITGESRE
jgi:hypothetical protein